MALSTYSDLQDAIAEWMGRPGDTLVAARATDFIAMFEASFRSRMRLRRMISTATLTIDAATVALPSDFLEVRNIYLTASPTQDLQQAGLDWIRTQFDAASTGQPRYYNISGGNILFAPTPSGSYAAELEYWAFAALSVSNPTNWLLTYYPHIYLRGSLREAVGWEGAGNHESMPVMNAALQEGLRELEIEDFRVNSASDSGMRADTWAP